MPVDTDSRAVPRMVGMVEVKPKQEVIDAILQERGSNYGAFATHAVITQRLKQLFYNMMLEHNPKQVLTLAERESIDMIFHKLGRIGNGNPHMKDHWIDIAGYAKLVADLCD